MTEVIKSILISFSSFFTKSNLKTTFKDILTNFAERFRICGDVFAGFILI